MLPLTLQTSISLGNLGVMATFIVGFVSVAYTLRANSPTGGETVSLLNTQVEALKRDVDDLRPKYAAAVEAQHQAELKVKDREKTIAELQARPDTQKMLDAFEMNQTAVLKVLADISEGLETLIHRDQRGRSTDS